MSAVPDTETLAEVLLASWRSQNMLHPPFDSDRDDALTDAAAILASDWLAQRDEAVRAAALREAADAIAAETQRPPAILSDSAQRVWMGGMDCAVRIVARTDAPKAQPQLPHCRACRFVKHDHGRDCHANCPTCHGESAFSPTARVVGPSRSDTKGGE